MTTDRDHVPNADYALPLDAIYDVLVEDCGANESERRDFKHQWPACREWRFRGHLGMGGKVWFSGGRVYVTCYSEDGNDERDRIIERADERLWEILAESGAHNDSSGAT